MFLHEHCISGPIQSRRLGTSLGVNLLPCSHKICNYNCVYCECGLNRPDEEEIRSLPTPQQIEAALDERLRALKAEGRPLHSITFSGNGEPTLHPQFETIMDIVCALRQRHTPHTPVSVISNASRLGLPEIRRAIGRADKRILKLDVGTPGLYGRINGLRVADPTLPIGEVAGRRETPTAAEITAAYTQLIENLHSLPYPFTLQTLFFRGRAGGAPKDHPTRRQIGADIRHVLFVHPPDRKIYGQGR
ncbi:MAG: hypothetical protein K2G46_02495, partial [Bacteroidales bacterium]|nr:hypothetical protein [Bacteroidales bacterium]